jgi:hypothetical protein
VKKASMAWIVGLAGMLGYELYAVFNQSPNDTLSEAVWRYGQHPMIGVVAGILIGHFWWQRKAKGSK